MQRKTQGPSNKNGGERSTGTPAYRVDELDLALIGRLRDEGRASNRSLAGALGVNDATIASRLRRLEEEDIVRVVAVTDMAAFGHELLAFGLVRVAGRDVLEVGNELGELEESIGVVVTTGRVDLVVSMLARDRAHLAELAGSSIPAVRGVEQVTWELALQVHKYSTEWAALGADRQPTEPWAASEVVDELDLRIIGLLQQDARSSNRHIASELGVSEGTVRTRIRRMEAERIIRIQAISDVRASGLTAGAYVGVTVEDGRVDEVTARLVASGAINAVIRSLGEFDLFLVLSTVTREALVHEVLHEIRALPGVRRTETIEHCSTLKHSYMWGHVL